MIELKSVRLKNVVYFKNALLPITSNNLTFIRGLNLDSDPMAPSSNGAGKSLLFSTIPNVFFFSPPLSLKKKAKKEILSKTSSIEIKLKNNDTLFIIRQTSTGYTIAKDNVDLEVSKIPVAEKLIQSIFPISEVLFYSTVFVSTQKSFPMQQSTDASRLEHLVDMFTLNQYDKLREHFAAKLREIKDFEVKYSMLEQQRLILKKKLAAATDKISGIREEEFIAEQEKLNKKYKSLDDKHHKFEIQIISLNSLEQTEAELDLLRGAYKYKDSPTVVEKRLKNLRPLIAAYNSYKEKLNLYISLRGKLLDNIKNVKLKVKGYSSYSQLLTAKSKKEEELESLNEKLRDLSKKKLRYQELKKELLELQKKLGEFKSPLLRYPIEELQSQIALCETSLGMADVIDHVHTGESVCPICMSSVNKKNIEKSLILARDRLPKLKAALAQKKCMALIKIVKEKLSDLKFSQEALDACKDKIDNLYSELSKLRTKILSHEALEKLREELKRLKKPVAMNKPHGFTSQKQLDEDLDLCQDILRHLAAKEKICDLHPEFRHLRTVAAIYAYRDKVKTEKDRLKKMLSSVNTSLSTVVTEINAYQSQKHEFSIYKSEYEECLRQIEKLKPLTDKKKLYESLTKAYGARGLRTIVVAKICSLIEDNLNNYRNLVFSEPFLFSIKATEQGVAIIVDRGNGVISDVRNLSGAESNCFRLLFILSILPLLPSDKRTNFLVLDEPTAHHDEVTRTLFRERFLPSICELVPHVFCITPNPDDYNPSGAEWLIKKEKGTSQLIKMNSDS